MDYYDGIVTFKGYIKRMFNYGMPYDWADLSPKEREKYAEREAAEPRERRKEPRT